MSRHATRLILIAVVSLTVLVYAAHAGPLLVAGSPGYDAITHTGMDAFLVYGRGYLGVTNTGTAIGCATKYIGGVSKGVRAVRWDASGEATELGVLGTDSNGKTNAYAYGINNNGTAVGSAKKYVAGISNGVRAVRWDASGTTLTELGNLGTGNSDGSNAFAYAINEAGTIVGKLDRYVSGYSPYGAARWDATGMAAALDNLGTDGDGQEFGAALAVNTTGTAVGWSDKYVDGTYLGSRAVRWDPSGVAATELGNLGTGNSGSTMAFAYSINDAGTIVGRATKYQEGTYLGYRAVRWDASGTTATELDGLSNNGSGACEAYAVNKFGRAVGYSDKIINGISFGTRAVRWDASSTTATELGVLGTSSNGGTRAIAYAVNGAGTAAGSSVNYLSGSDRSDHAVIWLPDTSPIDLNSLGIADVSNGGIWTLSNVKAISADGWVAGEGTFDPDGPGSLGRYGRLWVAQVGLGGNWNNAAGGTWGRGPNWSTGTPAMQVGNATFDLSSGYTVGLDRNESTKTIAVNAGELTVDLAGYTLSTENGLTIADGATFKSAGTIVSDVSNAGTLAPGTSPSVLAITGNLTNTGTLEFEIISLLDHNEIDLSGTLAAGGTIAVKLLDGYMPTTGDTFSLIGFDNFIDNGYVFDFSSASLQDGFGWDTASFATTGSIRVVPEPCAFGMLGVAAVALMLWKRRNWR